MNNTGKPINISKYPLIGQCYNLVREIDGLPASTEATFLVCKASELMDEVWNYLETHQPKSRLAGLMTEALESKYLGKKIKNKCFPNVIFTVDVIHVSPDGPDPQMTVSLISNKFEEASRVWSEWQLKNNPAGGKLTPPEIETPWQESSKESFYMSQVDDVLPEIVEEKI